MVSGSGARLVQTLLPLLVPGADEALGVSGIRGRWISGWKGVKIPESRT